MDLSIVLDDIKAPPAPGPGPAESGDLEGVFGHLRDEASRRQGAGEPEKEYRRALALRSAGDIDECIEALVKASRAPKLRFVAAALLGKLLPGAGQRHGIHRMVRACGAGAGADRDVGFEVLYDLADALEQAGEPARALAILMELQADAGDYRDIERAHRPADQSPDARVVV